MKFTVVWRAEVGDDLFEAAKWYDKKQERLGDEFIAEVVSFVHQLPDLPILPRVRLPKFQVRWAYPPRFPYRIYFRVMESRIVIYAVIHSARTNKNWQKRLEE